MEIVVRKTRNDDEEIRKPIVISQYTQNLGVLDRFDHMCSSELFSEKSPQVVSKDMFLVAGSGCK